MKYRNLKLAEETQDLDSILSTYNQETKPKKPRARTIKPTKKFINRFPKTNTKPDWVRDLELEKQDLKEQEILEQYISTHFLN